MDLDLNDTLMKTLILFRKSVSTHCPFQGTKYQMVDQNVLRICKVKLKNNYRQDVCLDLNTFLNLTFLVHTCAACSEVPSDIITIVQSS